MTVSLTERLEIYTPHDDQRKAIDFVLEHKDVLLKAPTGAGKTLVGVQAALEAGAKTILLIAPLNTESGWAETFRRQWQDTIDFHVVSSKAKGKVAFQNINDKVPGVYFVGREYFKRMSWAKVKPDFIIFDECHVATNRKSLMFKMLKTAKAPYKLAMSATPAGNKLEGLWTLGRWLWPRQIPVGFWNWATQWFETEVDEHASYDIERSDGEVSTIQGKKVTVEREPGALWKNLPAAFKMESVYKETPTVHWIEVDISPTQRKHYKELEEEAITWLNDNPLAVDIPAVLNARLRQICLAVPSVKQDWVKRKDKETGIWMDVWGDVVWFEEDAKSTKIDALVEILSDLHAEVAEPVVVFTDSRIFAQILTLRLQKKNFEARQFIGGMSALERAWKKDNFGVLYDIVVCTIPTVAEGLDGWQKFCKHEVWMNVSWNQLLNTQAAGRLSRQGQKNEVQRYMIVARDTVETKQIGKLKSTQQLLDAGYGD